MPYLLIEQFIQKNLSEVIYLSHVDNGYNR